MKKSAYIRFVLTFLLVFSMLSPTAVLAMGDGKKFFKEGLNAEAAEDWDKAVEQFVLAIGENPKNPEYRLHYVRALFNASQMYIRKGTALANEKDYKGGYDAFRKAYAYDPTNELAKAEMERMARLYKDTLDGGNPDNTKTDVKLVQTSFSRQVLPQGVVIPQKLDDLKEFIYVDQDLQTIIKDLARTLDLNVIFDSETFRTRQKVTVDLRGVTTAKALDYIFLQQNLFFQKVGPRTILVANTNARQKFQQLVLRTFYLANASPKDVIDLIGRIIPAQPGRTPTIAIKDDATNSITIRDTQENIQLMGQLIKSLDKDRAEVVMDVAIYEVNKTDLLQFGNQIGSETQLTNLAGVTNGVATANSSANTFRTAMGALIPQTIGVGLLIPTVSLAALQKKNNSKLIASTQIHAFNNEDSSARIGQRVPVKTASFQTGAVNTNGGGVVSDVINYEQVGLTLKFKPIVFPNQDVQVAMEIESKDVTGAQSLTPNFTERTIKGTARVQNNKTLLLASVAQNQESNGRSGLPLLGLIPIIGRLFTAPVKDNRQVDIVIAVTPRVIRAPSILPEDEIERPTGSLAVPTNGSLEAMVIQEEIEEQLANARRLGNNTAVQLPDQKVEEAPTYVRTNSTETSVKTEPKTENTTPTETSNNSETVAANIRPIDASNVRTLQVTPTSDNSTESVLPKPMTLPLLETSLKSENTETKADLPKAEVRFLPNLPEMKTGEKTKIAVMVRSATAFRSAVLGLKFDAQKLAVRSVSFGDIFGGDLVSKTATPYLNQNGKMYVSLSSSKNTAENSSGILAYIEVEALADGKHDISFDADSMNIMTADGKDFAVKF
ncbi:MAG TPA: secretin N-terminal domain-containing protein [Pyrinomonadaceae bacterium]|nr:secretin N-terminal domain-containing protein [Pyrinomonadaceae bacterium]